MWDGFASAGTASAAFGVQSSSIPISSLWRYFYYAHLAEYAKEFEVGETVLAGTHLGYMGDTGYSDIPGTTGNFPVHLHFGIYINDENGQELSVNPYPMVLYLWEQQGKYTFGETKRQ